MVWQISSCCGGSETGCCQVRSGQQALRGCRSVGGDKNQRFQRMHSVSRRASAALLQALAGRRALSVLLLTSQPRGTRNEAHQTI